ncbi:MAG: tetratricopeptide repeat protein [Planctomycetaceae bacterium]
MVASLKRMIWVGLFVCSGTLSMGAIAVGQQEGTGPVEPQPVGVQPVITSLPQIDAEIHQLMQSRKFEEAAKAIDKSLSDPKVDPNTVDYLLYLKGRALAEGGDLNGAMATFRRIETEYKEGRWVSRARFGQADILVKGRDYQAAGKIYQKEAERLLSRERKDELAEVYLEFADRYFDGIPSDDPAKVKQPDFGQALAYYQEALKLGPTVGLRQKIEFRVARCYEETGNTGSAIDAYRVFLQQHGGKEPKSGERVAVATEVEASYRLGDVLLKGGQREAARKVWQEMSTAKDLVGVQEAVNQPNKPLPLQEKETAEKWISKAKYRIPHTFGIPSPSTVGDLELGVAAAEAFIKANPDSEYAPRAELEIAQAQSYHGRFVEAATRLVAFIANPKYAGSEQVPVARRALGEAFLAQGKFDEAVDAWKKFLDAHPTDPSWSQVQGEIIQAEYFKGAYTLSQKKYDEARTLWQTFLNKYPLDARAPQIMYQFGVMKHAEGFDKHLARVKAAIDAGQSPQSIKVDDDTKKLYEEAIADWRRVVAKYPDSHEASHAAFGIGTTLEDRLGRLKEALTAYQQVTGDKQGEANQRIARLTEPQLEIVTERKFRSNEKPRLKLTTRNLESVDVKVYRVDMQDYFRKMHLTCGIETLDIALIDPDQQLTQKVADYEQYQQLAGDIELPVEGVGVWAVTVSSDKVEATTMVVVSDIDIIVKGSRNELFLFAENMLTGQPVDGASVLISDGSEVFATELTGKDGILQKSFDQLKSVEDLRVFVAMEGHIASTVTPLSGLQVATGLTNRGYLFTDRPAYRAGQLVNIKGIVRTVANDTFTFQAGEKYRLDITDARGRLIQQQEVALNGYGTIQSHLILPKTAPQGSYRVHLHQPNGTQSCETSFSVTEYKLEPIDLAVEMERDVYYRGEVVKGTISLKYYYGTPLANEAVQYTFGPDGEMVTTKTDAKGEIAVEFETQRFSESQPLQLTVHYPNRSLNATQTVYLATKGFGIATSTLRDVYINGETFDTTFKVTDPAGKPVETKLTVEVFEINGLTIPGRQHSIPASQKAVATYEVTTVKETGEARQTLKLDEPGLYVVRATGVDRFENKVSGETRVRISGDKDATRLRILADTHAYKVGDAAKVKVHWREAPALALVTYEGAQVLGYQLVSLKSGENTLAVPMTSKLAPNFNLSIAVMERNRFHSASSGFVVSQRLNIALKPDRVDLKPGDNLTVEIAVTDPQGQPWPGEVSLALVQSNLLNMFGDVQGAIDAFFSAGQRVPQLRQISSNTFDYRPQTRGISQFLLADAERRATLERELDALTRQQVREELSRVDAQSGTPRSDEQTRWMTQGDSAQTEMHAIVDDSVLSYSTNGGIAEGSELNALFGAVQGQQLEELNEAILQQQVDGITLRDFGNPIGLAGPPQIPYGQPAASPEQTLSNLRNLSPADGTPAGQGYGLPVLNIQNEPGRPAARGFSDYVFDTSDILTQSLDQKFSSQAQWGGVTDGRVFRLKALHDSNSDWSRSYLSQRDVTVNAVTATGQFLALNGRADADLTKLADAGALILPSMSFSETGFWDPTIVTDAQGKASVVITMPTRSTAWKLRAKGINDNSLAGEAEVSIVTKKDLFGDMKLPLALTQGDALTVPVEVHNSLNGKRTIDLQLAIGTGDSVNEEAEAARQKPLILTQQIEVEGPGVSKVNFSIPAEIVATTQGTKQSALHFALTVASGPQRDLAERTVPVRPDGASVYAATSGTTAQSMIAMVKLEEDLGSIDPQLAVVIGPSVNRTLFDAVLGNGSVDNLRCFIPSTGTERAVSDVLGGLALLEMIGVARQNDTPEGQAIAGKIKSALSQLVSAQQEDGGWVWSVRNQNNQSDRFMTSRVMWGLAVARKGGFAVPQEQFDSGKRFLQSAFSNAKQNEIETQCVLLQAMAACDCADFAFINRLHRDRNSLSKGGLLHLALALHDTGRPEMATELLSLAGLNRDIKPAPWMSSNIELTALELLAYELLKPADPQVAKLVEQLQKQRVGSRWPVEKANGPAIAALAKWSARTQHVSEKYTLTIFVNDKQVEKLTFDPSVDGSRRIEVPTELLVAGTPQRINFDMEGRGEFSYSAILTAFVPTAKLKETTQDFYVGRRYEPARLMFDGREVPRGFGVVTGNYTTFYNAITQLPVGDRTEVLLRPRRRDTSNRPDDQHDYLILTEPIPAGCVVLDGSVSGSYQWYDIEAGQITFYLGDTKYPGDITYTLVGYVPGQFKATPTILRNFYNPTQMAVGEPKNLAVLKEGEQAQDEYKLSPEELYHLGQRELVKGNFAAAHGHLTQLYGGYTLNGNTHNEVVQWLLKTSLAQKSHSDTVKFFEIIKEKLPEVEVSFEEILQVALSYRELGEYERSWLVYRATVQGSFERESQTAGFLDQRGEFLRSLQVLEKLFADYPAEPYIASATYALAQETFRRAPLAKDDEKLKEAQVNRVHLTTGSIKMLDHFVTTFPNDPAADAASFATATALIDLDQYEQAIVRCNAFAERYPESKLLDSFWYIIGYAHFELGQHQQALDMCRKVAEAKFNVPATGGTRDADNKWEALYIMGQVYHSLGKAADAIAEYTKVKDRFADAAQAIDFFNHKEISIDEVTTLRPEEEKHLKLKFRNIPEVAVKVYRIDLMKFGLMQRNLDRITAINLAGIKPYHEESIKLGDGNDYRDREQTLTLPLKDEGAYLVVCRGENLYASGLAVVSPLNLEVQEDAVSGRVRVTVKDTKTDTYAGKVHVKVIGSANSDFNSGETDLRGLFIADDVKGTSTVIALADNSRYAFYRGEEVLQNVAPNSPTPQQQSGQQYGGRGEESQPESGKDLLRGNIKNLNFDAQQLNNGFYNDLLQNTRQGIRSKEAK